jgi:UDP-N-acetylmuramoyl-tripeptide--D-alanyl-D-alanine ligase|tara:strand:- start:4895 stop:6313 length:1419 start_codon:yes stop_codon:yes gene_type:complete
MERRSNADERLLVTLEDLARVVDGRVVAGALGMPLDGFSIDSRSLDPGDLFVAIRGDRFDGHAFVADAVARGACGALVSDAAALGASGGVGVVVGDTLLALQALGQHIRRASNARVVAITGSAGKTTTKELTAAVLGARYRVFRNRGNLNNHIGLPLSLLALRTRPEVAVVELGMNGPGEIRRLVEIAEPELRVWTNVAEVHAEFFPSIEAIADAKAEILEGASPDTVVVANAADQRIMTRVAGFQGRVATFGVGVDAEVTATEVEDRGLDGTRALVRTPAGATTLTTSLPGRGNLANILAAVAVALQLQVPLGALAERVATVEAPPHRGQLRRLARGVVVIDDTYNANPLAVVTALQTLSQDRREGRRVAVLGEMLELGARSEALHRKTGRAAASAGLGLLLTVGGDPARALGAAAVEAGMSSDRVIHFESSEEAATRLTELLQADDVVLVKGSRSVRTDLVVSRLEAEWA